MYEAGIGLASVVKSADRLNVDQTAVSAQVRILEQQLR